MPNNYKHNFAKLTQVNKSQRIGGNNTKINISGNIAKNNKCIMEYICQNCGKAHDGTYGSGRFCSIHCQISFSNKKRGNLSIETKQKISNSLKKEKNKICSICGKPFIAKGKEKYCSSECKRFSKIIPTFIKYFSFDENIIGTSDIFKEVDRIKNMLYKDYWSDKLSGSLIAKKYDYPNPFNLTGKIFRYLDIPRRNFSEATINAYNENRLSVNIVNPIYKHGWHTTWNNKQVYLRSSYEFDYAKYLDDNKIEYSVEQLRIPYYNSQLDSIRCAIPDFYLIQSNTIVEIKSEWTLNIQEMKDKFKAYKQLGYNCSLLYEHKEIDLYAL